MAITQIGAKESENFVDVWVRNEPLLVDNKQTADLVHVSVKITILAITALLSSVILITFRAIVNFMEFHQSLSNPLLYDVFQSFWLQMDTIISCLCLILFLPQTSTVYRILCCCCIGLLSNCVDIHEIEMEFSIKHQKATMTWSPISVPNWNTNSNDNDDIKDDNDNIDDNNGNVNNPVSIPLHTVQTDNEDVAQSLY